VSETYLSLIASERIERKMVNNNKKEKEVYKNYLGVYSSIKDLVECSGAEEGDTIDIYVYKETKKFVKRFELE
jgi:hypothetical protein